MRLPLQSSDFAPSDFAPSTFGKGGHPGALPLRLRDGATRFESTGATLIRRIEPDAAMAETRRTRLWELHVNLHCSVIGTCLSTGDLRDIIAKFVVVGSEPLNEHELHKLVVHAAAKQGDFSRQIHKTLDKRHQRIIRHFAQAKTDAELLTLWHQAVKNSDIPGAYWASLTHPAATQKIVTEAFGTVHMLSHLVGAANRADIRRLRELESEKAELEAKIERQQSQLRDAVISRDEKIRSLGDALSKKLSEFSTDGEAGALASLVADLERRLAASDARRERAEQRLQEVGMARKQEQEHSAALTLERDALLGELQAIEAKCAGLVEPADAIEAGPDLHGLSLLYVGGRPHQVAQLRLLAERAAGSLLHHDGGIEDRGGLLAGLVSRADAALFPVDCISHEAALALKRLCRQAGKPWIPLRTASAASFLAAVATLSTQAALSSPG